MTFRAVGLVLLLPLLLLAGCGRTVERKAEQMVNEVLPAYLGPAEKYSTRIHGDSAGAVIRGRLRSVHIDGQKVQLAPDLVVDEVTLDFAEVEVDTKSRRLRAVGSAEFTCRIGEARLNHYLRSVKPDIPELAVRLRGDTLFVRAKPEVLGVLPVPVEVEGRLRPRPGGRLLDFDPDRARVSILPIPGVVIDYLAQKLSPTIDLSRLTIPIHVRSTQVRGGVIVLSGYLDPDDILKAAETL